MNIFTGVNVSMLVTAAQYQTVDHGKHGK